jgi:serine/threonine kinase 16
VQDTATSELFALKKIRCPFGAESVAQAMKEVEAYKIFAHSPGVIHSVDYSIATERGSGEESKTVYVLLPYYRRGNLQDMINANLVNHTRFPEKRLMLLFLGVCRAMRDMHLYKGGAGAGAEAQGGTSARERMEMRADGADENARSAKGTTSRADEDDETEQQRPLMMDDERLPAVVPGAMRSYAHRDIKPGEFFFSSHLRRTGRILTEIPQQTS